MALHIIPQLPATVSQGCWGVPSTLYVQTDLIFVLFGPFWTIYGLSSTSPKFHLSSESYHPYSRNRIRAAHRTVPTFSQSQPQIGVRGVWGGNGAYELETSFEIILSNFFVAIYIYMHISEILSVFHRSVRSSNTIPTIRMGVEQRFRPNLPNDS